MALAGSERYEVCEDEADAAGGLTPVKEDRRKSAEDTGCQACLPCLPMVLTLKKEGIVNEKAA